MQLEHKGFVRSQHAEALTHVVVQASLHGQPWGQWLFCTSSKSPPKAFCIGWSGRTHAPVGPQVVTNATHRLIEIGQDACALHLTDAMACVVTSEGAQQPCTEREVALRRDQAALIRCGAFTFTATWQAPPAVVAPPAKRALRSLWPEALSLAVVLFALLILWLVPPDRMALSVWNPQRTIFMPDTTRIPPVPPAEKPIVTEAGATSGKTAAAAHVKSPTITVSKPPGSRGPQPDGKAPRETGMLEVLSDLGRSSGVVRTLFAPGDGMGEVLQGLSTADVSLGDNTGGLHVSLDEGPAGQTVGDGRFHTVGDCPPGTVCAGRRNFRQAGTLKQHIAREPVVAMPCEAGSPLCGARGALDKELVRREIRKHISEIKYCYEQQLVRAPSLSGRVAVRFVIVATGAVAASSIAESSLGDASVEACVANAVKRWQFPVAQQAGATIVTYPFSFSPAGG